MPQTAHPYTANLNQPIEVPPGGMRRIDLGSYRSADGAPEFKVHYQAGVLNTVSYHDTVIEQDDGEHYRLVRHLQNFGDKTVVITVLRVP